MEMPVVKKSVAPLDNSLLMIMTILNYLCELDISRHVFECPK